MAPSDKTAIRCRGVTKSYGAGDVKVGALRGVDLDVRLGELLMVVGPSGSGKTTLLSVITAILDPDGGECEVLGRDLLRMPPEERMQFRAAAIGFVFQSFHLLPSLTALENVSVPLLINRVPRLQAEARSRETLRSVDLGERAQARPRQLSGGQQQRVAIARALVHDPQLIVCDEPTSNLDHETGERMMELLRLRAQSPHRALVVVTHDNRILRFADRIARMDDGRVVETFPGEGRAS
jgi:putative ABC transport system ATP-binding protein